MLWSKKLRPRVSWNACWQSHNKAEDLLVHPSYIWELERVLYDFSYFRNCPPHRSSPSLSFFARKASYINIKPSIAFKKRYRFRSYFLNFCYLISWSNSMLTLKQLWSVHPSCIVNISFANRYLVFLKFCSSVCSSPTNQTIALFLDHF